MSHRAMIPLAASALLVSVALPAMAAEVTPERLLNADKEPQNWLTVHQNYASHRFSGLDQITRDNVAQLRPLFTTAIGGLPGGGNYAEGGLQATPLVNDGAMYV